MFGFSGWLKYGLHLKPCHICNHKILPWEQWEWKTGRFIPEHQDGYIWECPQSSHTRCINKWG